MELLRAEATDHRKQLIGVLANVIKRSKDGYQVLMLWFRRLFASRSVLIVL